MTQEANRARVRRVLWVTLVLNVIVAVGKIAIGATTGAVAITADGFHSLMDGSANVIALVANRIAAKPADADHPYGHRRYETLAALGVGILLLVTAWEIVSSAIERLTSPQPVTVTPLVFGVLVATLIVNLVVSTVERREGERLKSELLIADAANTRADVLVTISVLISMGLTAAGFSWADPLAALIIVVLIARAAWSVIQQTGGVLVDTAPYDPAQLAALAAKTPGIERVIRARSRGTADAAFIDIDVQVPPEMTAGHAAVLAGVIRERLAAELHGVQEIEVHFAPPEDAAAPDYALAARAQADALGLSTHEVIVRETSDGKIMEMHVEVPPNQTLAEAHAQVTALEVQVRSVLPDVHDVITHIEPRAGIQIEDTSAPAADDLSARVIRLLTRLYPEAAWHELHAIQTVDGCALTLHVGLDQATTVQEAHRLAEEAETTIKANYPVVTRVTIHTEPPEGEKPE